MCARGGGGPAAAAPGGAGRRGVMVCQVAAWCTWALARLLLALAMPATARIARKQAGSTSRRAASSCRQACDASPAASQPGAASSSVRTMARTRPLPEARKTPMDAGLRALYNRVQLVQCASGAHKEQGKLAKSRRGSIVCGRAGRVPWSGAARAACRQKAFLGYLFRKFPGSESHRGKRG